MLFVDALQVYINKHVQPSSDPCVGSLLTEFYGNVSAVNTIRYIAAASQTGMRPSL